MRTAIVGYGLAGRVFHGSLLASTPGIEVVAVVTRNPERRAQARHDFPDASIFDGVDGMLKTARPDLAVVASATAAHPGDAGACVAAGVPVVVDKPLAATAEAAAAIVESAGQARVPLTVFQNRRWDADILTLRRLLADGSLGRVLRFESRFERWRPTADLTRWREQAPPGAGGGTLLDLGAHLVDQAYTLFGPVTHVYAEVRALRGGADDDVFLALTHRDGTIAHLWCGALTAAPGPRLRVLGDAGALVVAELDGQEAALRAGRGPHRAAPQEMELVRGEQRQPVRPEPGGWSAFYPAVVTALRTGAKMPVDPGDAVAVLRVLDAARGAAERRRVLEVRRVREI